MRIIKEEIIGAKSPWVMRARLVSYHNNKVIRTEVMFEKVDKVAYQDEIGWTVEELEQLQQKLIEWQKKQG